MLAEGVTYLPGGWRKRVFLVEGKKRGEEKRLVCLVPKEAISKRRLLEATALEEKMGGRKLLAEGEIDNYWWLVLS